MSFLIQDAFAQGAQQPQADFFQSMLFLGLILVVFWLIAIRPQMKRQKEHREMIAALSKGDEAVTNGGLAGRIREVGENFVTMEIAKGVDVKVQKQFVQTVLPKGSLKDI